MRPGPRWFQDTSGLEKEGPAPVRPRLRRFTRLSGSALALLLAGLLIGDLLRPPPPAAPTDPVAAPVHPDRPADLPAE